MYIHSKHFDEIDFSIERWNWEFFEILLQVVETYETNPGMELVSDLFVPYYIGLQLVNSDTTE